MKALREKLIGVNREDLAPIMSENSNVGPAYAVQQFLRNKDGCLFTFYLCKGSPQESTAVWRLLRQYRPRINFLKPQQRFDPDNKQAFETLNRLLSKEFIDHREACKFKELIERFQWKLSKGSPGRMLGLFSFWNAVPELAVFEALQQRQAQRGLRGVFRASAKWLKEKAGIKRSEYDAITQYLKKNDAMSNAYKPIRLLEQTFLTRGGYVERQPNGALEVVDKVKSSNEPDRPANIEQDGKRSYKNKVVWEETIGPRLALREEVDHVALSQVDDVLRLVTEQVDEDCQGG